MGLKWKESNSWNPKSNSILERINQVLGDGLRAFDLDNININHKDDDPFNDYTTALAYAIRFAYHQTHGHSPGQLVYGQNMFSPVESNIEGNKIIYRKQNKNRRNKERENFKNIDHNFRKGD